MLNLAMFSESFSKPVLTVPDLVYLSCGKSSSKTTAKCPRRLPSSRQLKASRSVSVPALICSSADDKGKAAIWPTPSFGIKQPEGQVVLKISVNVDEDWSKRLTLGEEDLNGGLAS